MFDAKMPGIFISYRHKDSADVAGRLFDWLSRRFGEKNVFRDIYTLDGGVEFAKDIRERIRGCAVLIALIDKNWLDARDPQGRRRLDDPNDFLAAEISEALNHGKRVIPALIEGAPMPEREALPPGLASLAQRHAIPITDAHFDDDVRRLIGAIEDVISPPDDGSGLPPQELRNRRDLISDVKDEVENRLAQSLHDAALINLLKEKQPQQVRRPWDEEVTVAHRPSTALPPGTEIIDVFDQEAIAGKLLILGAPGAGKTTTLLQLARELVARPEANVRMPMPVLLNLSSWKEDDQNLAPWLQTELKLKYGVRKDVGQRWLEERCLLPLLDGLDELEPTRQEKCVQAINQLHQDYRPDCLVVCCRLAEYQNSKTKLQLNGAIYLRPLTDEQICEYLVSAKSPDLWDSIQIDTELSELARSPLLLSMITLADEERSLQQWLKFSSPQERHQYLFDMYVERMLSLEISGEEHRKQKTLHCLAWLARRLKEQARTAFLIESLQPTWLQPRAEKWIYHFVVGLVVALIFAAFAWSTSLLFEIMPGGKLTAAVEQSWAAIVGSGGSRSQMNTVLAITAGLVVTLVIGLKQTIKPVETLHWSGTKARSGMVAGLRRWSITGLKYGTYVGLIAGPIYYLWSLELGVADGLLMWSGVGKVAGIIFGLMAWMFTLLLVRPNAWLAGCLRNRLTVRSADAFMSGLIVALSVGLSFRKELGSGLLFGVLAGLAAGFVAGLVHRPSNRPVFTMSDALIVGLIAWLISGLSTWLTGGVVLSSVFEKITLSLWMDTWLYGWLGVAVAAGLIAGLLAKIREKARPVETVQRAETELWSWLARRWRQWLIAGIVAGLICSLILGSFIGMGYTRVVRAIGLIGFSLGMEFIHVLAFLSLGALTGAAIGTVNGGPLGALLGALGGGLIGPDIERRTIPNQGIRQSAINIGVFALLGGFTLGSIWGLLTLADAVLMTGVTPEASDWLRYGLFSMLFLGFISALVPGAACIQHFALRFILWCRGVAPWHYARFLDYATERMLLQRVGGRYRFMHDLLRNHFAAMEPKRVES